ncbi:MAG: hypothetical protein M3168_02755 [Actinomycetota bacterium]|nr:hypothetical protein [Actinomycetota bacterium]
MRKFRLALAVLFVAALVVPLTAAAAPVESASTHVYSQNMHPLGDSPRPNPSSGVFNSDLAFWGTRAYQGTYDGFRIIDISQPDSPTALIDYDECFGNQGDVIIWNNILVRSWNSANTSATRTCDGQPVPLGFEGLHVFDVSEPTNPELLGSVQTLCGSHTATGVPDVANNRLLVYNSASSGTCPWIDIVEVPLDDPSSASLLDVALAGRSCHDTSVILGDELLAACAGGNGFTVFSVGGPRGGSLTDPLQLYTRSVPGVSIAHSTSFSWDGEVLVFGHEPGGGSGARCQVTSAEVDKTLFFFEADTGADLGRWVLERPQTAQENCTIHNFNIVPTTKRDVLVSGNYQMGIAVVDFTDPANPRQIAYADPTPLVPTQLGGDWSTYWYDGLIYESDITRGLITWNLSDSAVAGALKLGHLNPQTQEFTIG